MRSVRVNVCRAVLALVVAGIACSPTKAVFKSAFSGESGRDGWRKGSVSVAEVEAVRNNGDRVVITPGPQPDTYTVRVAPKTLAMPTPPGGGDLVLTDSAGLTGEGRVYRVPPGSSWERIRAWYLDWFDFKPVQ